ncbi:MAG: Crp/Fnr family transcriptional regulator, partial [Rhizobiales bacterium]|nr:Crp/Fnr family transcriptional regulator [Hyphomicrobiales bacterium]
MDERAAIAVPAKRATSMQDWLPAAMKNAGLERALKAGEHLFHLGDKTAGIYQVVRGQVRLVRVGTNGQTITLYAASAGDFIAEASLYSPTYHCDAVAATNAVVRLYPKAGMLAEFDRNPKTARAFMAMLAHQVMTLRARLEQRNIRSVRDRVRHF